MELTIGTLIKIILGLLVVTAVIYGIYVSGSYFTDFINNVAPSKTAQTPLFLLK